MCRVATNIASELCSFVKQKTARIGGFSAEKLTLLPLLLLEQHLLP